MTSVQAKFKMTKNAKLRIISDPFIALSGSADSKLPSEIGFHRKLKYKIGCSGSATLTKKLNSPFDYPRIEKG